MNWFKCVVLVLLSTVLFTLSVEEKVCAASPFFVYHLGLLIQSFEPLDQKLIYMDENWVSYVNFPATLF